MNEKVNCCFCNKEIDMKINVVPPAWYGKFEGGHVLISITCSECLIDPINLKNWKAAK